MIKDTLTTASNSDIGEEKTKSLANISDLSNLAHIHARINRHSKPTMLSADVESNRSRTTSIKFTERFAVNEIKNIISPSRTTKSDFYKKTQRWKGQVIEVYEDGFSAKLEDLNNPSTYEIADFDLEEITPSDKPLVKSGKIFYWSVGYHVNKSGQVTKESLIRFQRLPQWTTNVIDRITDTSRDLASKLNWD